MISQEKFVEDNLSHHPINLVAHVGAITYVKDRAVLNIRLRDEFSTDCSASGVLGVIVDYVARVAGREFIGNCFVLEQEIFVHSPVLGRALMVSATIEFSIHQNAAYRCKIFSVTSDNNKLVGESQGTLLSS